MRIIEITDETYQIIKDYLPDDEKINISSLEELIGKKWFFRTVTYHMVGLATRLIGKFVMLENASWVADSGRFMQAIKEGKLEEVEPVGIAFVNLDTVTDFFPWNFELPREQK
jgi:hypothetical protein